MTTAASAEPTVADRPRLRVLGNDGLDQHTLDDQELAVQELVVQEWQILKETRLQALRDSPSCFLSSFHEESKFSDDQWRSEFDRARWLIAKSNEQLVGMLGITWYDDIPEGDRYLEYFWVSPESRGKRIGSKFVRWVVNDLEERHASAVWLWILDGNDGAQKFYLNLGFHFTEGRHVLKHPAGAEYQMRRRLSHRPPAGSLSSLGPGVT